MSIDALGLVTLLILMLLALVRFQQHATRVFGVMLLALLALQWVSTAEVLRNAANPGLVTLVLLVIISYALEKTSLLRRLSRYLFTASQLGSVIRTVGFSALASSVLNNTAVVAAMLGAVRSNNKVPPSKLLIPLSYAAIIGGTVTLIGTSTNLIVHSMLAEKDGIGFGFFDFTIVGLALTLGCGLVLIFTCRWLPNDPIVPNFAADYLLEAALMQNSPLVGKTIEEAGLRHLNDLFLVEIIRNNQLIRPVAHYDLLAAGDRLIFSGDVQNVSVLKQFPGVRLFAEVNGLATETLTEVIIKEDSVLVGSTLKQAGFRALFDAAVVAVRREGERIAGRLGDLELKTGDFLLLAAGPDFASRKNLAKNFYVLSGVKTANLLSGWREKLTWLGFSAMILVSVLTTVSLLTAAIFLLALLLLSGCLTVNDIKRRFPLPIWLVVVSALSLATAIMNTGLSDFISQFATATLAGQPPLLTFIGLFLLTYLLTEIITNNAAAALMFPLAYSLAQGLDVNVMPMVLAVAFAASASFITPYGYQTNLMVFNAGGYRLSHFMKVGIPVAISYILICVLLIPQVYPF